MKSILLRALALVGAIAGAAVGCGPSGGSLPLSEFRTRFFDGYCKYLVSCDEFPDLETCRASLQEQRGFFASLQQDIDAGRVKYDAAQASHCVGLVESFHTCKLSEVANAVNRLDTECGTIFTGTVAMGGACFLSEQCASGLCARTDAACSPSRQCCAGTCTAVPPPVPVGGDCSNLQASQSCADNSVCDRGAGQTFVCTARVTTEGAPCSGLTTCLAPFFCDLDPDTGMGTCKRVAATGETCNPNTARSCDDGRDLCVAATAVCTRKGAVGAACTPETCVGWASCQDGTCVARPKAGEACGGATDLACLGGLQCVSMTCALVPAGDACR